VTVAKPPRRGRMLVTIRVATTVPVPQLTSQTLPWAVPRAHQAVVPVVVVIVLTLVLLRPEPIAEELA